MGRGRAEHTNMIGWPKLPHTLTLTHEICGQFQLKRYNKKKKKKKTVRGAAAGLFSYVHTKVPSVVIPIEAGLGNNKPTAKVLQQELDRREKQKMRSVGN